MPKKLDIPFIKIFFRLSFPVIISELVLLVGNNVSMALLGTLSEKALSAFSVANEAFNIYSMVILGLTGGFHVFIAQYYGSSNQEKYNQVLRVGLKLAFYVGLVFNAALFLFAQPFSKVFLSDAETLQYAVPYLRIFSLTFIPYAVNLVASGSYSMIGKAKVALYGGTLNCVTNILFCYLLIYGGGFFPQMGIEGAAMALVIARLAESALLFIIMNLPKSTFKFSIHYPRLTKPELFRVLKTSAPLILNEVLFSIAFMFVFLNYSYAGEKYLACIPVVTTVTNLVFVPARRTAAAVGVLIGGNLGKGDMEEAKKNAQKILFLCLLIIDLGCVLIALASPLIPKIFSLQGEVYQMAVSMLLIKAGCSLLGGITMVFYNTLRVGGDTRSVFLLDGVFSCCGPLLASFLFSRIFCVPFLVLYFAVEFMNVIKTLLGYYFFKKERWLHRLS